MTSQRNEEGWGGGGECQRLYERQQMPCTKDESLIQEKGKPSGIKIARKMRVKKMERREMMIINKLVPVQVFCLFLV